MPFGVIQINAAPERPKPVKSGPPPVQEQIPAPPIPSAPLSSGTEQISVLVLAPSMAEAADFVCGMYFNMVQMTSGSAVSVYTRDLLTVTRLTGRKQDLEDLISKRAGTEIRRDAQDDGALAACTVTIAQSGNQPLSIDLNIRCAVRGTADGGADAVFCLMRPGEEPSAVGAGLSFRILCGLEERTVFAQRQTAEPLSAELARELHNSGGGRGYSACAQVYGGLEFVRREGTELVFRSSVNCRAYAPVACHIPAFTAAAEIGRSRQAQGDAPAAALYNLLWDCFCQREPARQSWCGANEEAERQ